MFSSHRSGSSLVDRSDDAQWVLDGHFHEPANPLTAEHLVDGGKGLRQVGYTAVRCNVGIS